MTPDEEKNMKIIAGVAAAVVVIVLIIVVVVVAKKKKAAAAQPKKEEPKKEDPLKPKASDSASTSSGSTSSSSTSSGSASSGSTSSGSTSSGSASSSSTSSAPVAPPPAVTYVPPAPVPVSVPPSFTAPPSPPPPAVTEAQAQQLCSVSAWEPWTECDCNERQISSIRMRSIVTPGANCPNLMESRQCDYSQCTPPQWNRFYNTYVSDGQYLSRSDMVPYQSCVDNCVNNSDCAGLYMYDRTPDIMNLPDKRYECSVLGTGNIDTLYNNKDQLSDGDRRIALIYVPRAGALVRPGVGSNVTL